MDPASGASEHINKAKELLRNGASLAAIIEQLETEGVELFLAYHIANTAKKMIDSEAPQDGAHAGREVCPALSKHETAQTQGTQSLQ